jgi:serine protease Do
MPARPAFVAPALAALVAAALAAGCATPPATGPSSVQLATNNRLSDVAKAKSFRAYKEMLFVPPAEDRLGLAPRVAEGLGKLGYAVRTMDPRVPLEPSQGTAFVVDAEGWLVTAAHVVGTERVATVTLGGQRRIADVFKADAKADLALLKLREPPPAGTAVLRFRAAAKPAQLGEEVSTLGYPLSRLLGSSVRMSRGLLSATAGLRDDPRELQVSAEIQPGSSGGPLLDRDGNVIGVVVKTLNPQAVARATGGALPQNVNFAVKAEPVLEFLKGADATLFRGLRHEPGTGLAGADRAVARVQAGDVVVEPDRSASMVVRLVYTAGPDGLLRFFALSAFDGDTQELLFATGQGNESAPAPPNAVVRDALAMAERAVKAR